MHYLSTTYATIQDILCQHYRNHRGPRTGKYLLTFQPSRDTCVYCLVAVRIGCQERTGIRFYLQDARNHYRFPVEKPCCRLLIVNPAMQELRKYSAVLFCVLCPSFNQAVFYQRVKLGEFSGVRSCEFWRWWLAALCLADNGPVEA
jgi:hypothetical protein